MACSLSGMVKPLTPGAPLMITRGKLYEIVFWYEGKPKDGQGSIGVKRLGDRGGYDVMQAGMNARATYRWIARPGGEIVTSEKDPVIIYAEKIPGLTARIAAHVEASGENYYFFGDEQHSRRVL